MKNTLTLRIVLESPPEGVDFGLQKGRGSAYETVQTQRYKGGDLEFEFIVEVKADGKSLLGPFVQGLPGQRFVYIDIGTLAGQKDSCWCRRLKIPLSGITMHKIKSGTVWEARVPGTGKRGGPNCATPEPFGGWKLHTN